MSSKQHFIYDKLKKEDWDSIEQPIPEQERFLLTHFIQCCQSAETFDKAVNHTPTIAAKVRLDCSDSDKFLFTEFILPPLQKIWDEKCKNRNLKSHWENWFRHFREKVVQKGVKLKSADKLRLSNIQSKQSEFFSEDVFEMTILKHMELFFRDPIQLFVLRKLFQRHVDRPSPYLQDMFNTVILANTECSPANVLEKAVELFEKTPVLQKNKDIQMYEHQQQLVSFFDPVANSENYKRPKLVLYCAPTNSGKTVVSPLLLLSKNKRMIYICAAKHIGMMVAHYSLFMGFRPAFAFGCCDMKGIRVHNSAIASHVELEKEVADPSNPSKKKKIKIKKPNHEDGSLVQIIVSDLASFRHAQAYMQRYVSAEPENLICYWDEPTIGMDCDDDPHLHPVIRKNWSELSTHNLVLSCATLPSQDELLPAIQNFASKFCDGEVELYNIRSPSYTKSISVVDSSNNLVLPHYLCSSMEELHCMCDNILENRTLMRYMDLREVVQYLLRVQIVLKDLDLERMEVNNYFGVFHEIDGMTQIKDYYLDLLQCIKTEKQFAWLVLQEKPQINLLDIFKPFAVKSTVSDCSVTLSRTMSGKPIQKMHSVSTTSSSSTAASVTAVNKMHLDGLMLLTTDAITLTDGPSIYLANNILNVAKFFGAMLDVKEEEMAILNASIAENNRLSKQISDLEKELEDRLSSLSESRQETAVDENLIKRGGETNMGIRNELTRLKSILRPVCFHPCFIPNTREHQMKYHQDNIVQQNAFVPTIEEDVIKEVMASVVCVHAEIALLLKKLFLVGVGVFSQECDPGYLKIMYDLASKQKLLLIIADEDYIWGTNYQMCHGIIGKDLKNMTQQKIIQAIGRVGRSEMDKPYSVRFRRDELIRTLFFPCKSNKEAEVMVRLCTSEE